MSSALGIFFGLCFGKKDDIRFSFKKRIFLLEENLSSIEGSDPFPKQVRKEAEQGYCSPTVITVSGWPDERS